MELSRNKILIIALVIFLLLACFIPAIWLVLANRGESGIKMLSEAANFGDQPTAFQPFKQTATPTRDVRPITNALVPNESMLPPEGQINILILGSDYRPTSGYRTDVVLLISVYTKEAKVKMVSFPRDLLVQIPGHEEERINTAMQTGGFALMSSTFEYNFAAHIDHYMMTNFNGFKGIIDTLGGIDIETTANTSDRCDLSYQHGAWCSIGPGAAHLDGELALWYVRSRYTTSDFDRTRRAQEVLIGTFKKLMSLDAVSKAPEIYNLLINNVETDLTVTDILPILGIAPAILSEPARISRFAIGLEQSSPTNNGAYLLQPDYNKVWQVIKEAVYTP
ncbi:MAG: LCP family protein [Anaerolineaceae bacterium]|nr:LCP family protein [Anaerolineaceae bacterium]